jgi:hypothetical protein
MTPFNLSLDNMSWIISIFWGDRSSSTFLYEKGFYEFQNFFCTLIAGKDIWHSITRHPENALFAFLSILKKVYFSLIFQEQCVTTFNSIHS